MFLTHRYDYDPETSAVYQSYAWHAVTVSLQESLFIVQLQIDPDQGGITLTETRILASPDAVLDLAQEYELSLVDLETTILCPKWLSKTSEPWKTYRLNSILKTVTEDGHTAGWQYETISGEKIYDIYGSENPDTLEWKKVG